ncbi:MAG: hypothetical protein R3Y08_00575 [Rikenellaceae bacterium]
MRQRIFKIFLLLAISLPFSVISLNAQGVTRIVTISEDGVRSEPIYVLNTQTTVDFLQNQEYIDVPKKESLNITKRRHDLALDLRLLGFTDVSSEYSEPSRIGCLAISLTYKGIYLMYAHYSDNDGYDKSANSKAYISEDEVVLGYSKIAYFGQHMFCEGIIGVGLNAVKHNLGDNDMDGLNFHASPRIGYEFNNLAIFAECRYRSNYFLFGDTEYTVSCALGISLRL